MRLGSNSRTSSPPRATDDSHSRQRKRHSVCFSSTSSFVAAGVIGAIGVATLRHVREPRALLFASLPMLFAVHQLTEGFVWLGLEGRIGKVALDHVAFLFMIYAQGILPFLLPLAVLLMEPRGPRRAAVLGLTAVGALVGVWNIIGVVGFPSRVFVEHHSIAYRNPLTGSFSISCLYVLATCGALLLSTHRGVRSYGLVNVIALTVAQLFKEYAFASPTCGIELTASARTKLRKPCGTCARMAKSRFITWTILAKFNRMTAMQQSRRRLAKTSTLCILEGRHHEIACQGCRSSSISQRRFQLDSPP